MPQETPRKILVLCQSYYKSTIIKKLLPWEQMGYKLLIGLNSYYGVSAIRKINPFAMIIVDYVPGPTIKALTDTYRDISAAANIILIPYEQIAHPLAEAEAITVIPWEELNAEKVLAALRSVKTVQERSGLQPARWPKLRAFQQTGAYGRAVVFRIVMQNRVAEELNPQVEDQILRAIHKAGGGTYFREKDGRYGFAVGMPAVVVEEVFFSTVQLLEQLQAKLKRLSGGHVTLFLSEIVPIRMVEEEYEKLIPLERYIFFYTERPILSAAYIHRHTINQDTPLDGVYARYAPLLQAVLCGEEDALGLILEDIYLNQIKRYRNMTYFRLVHSQLMAVHACVCCIKAPDEIATPFPDTEYWSVEDALADQKARFLSRMDRRDARQAITPLVSRALECIIRKHSEAVFAGTIAEQVGVSGAHLSRVFKQNLGIGITECIRYVRIYSAAVDLLKGSMSIRAVSEKHGFSDSKYFNKVFHQLMGQSPSQWLERQNVQMVEKERQA